MLCSELTRRKPTNKHLIFVSRFCVRFFCQPRSNLTAALTKAAVPVSNLVTAVYKELISLSNPGLEKQECGSGDSRVRLDDYPVYAPVFSSGCRIRPQTSLFRSWIQPCDGPVQPCFSIVQPGVGQPGARFRQDPT